MAQWSNTASESGILRKNKPKENHDDLLVFGYACKLFRDDDKALYIDQGKHLIPWMGDDNLKIDRYDCRGALSDIKLYESSREGYDTIRWLGLNESERKIEQLCDKERYYALEINEEEERMYKEEEEKRLKANQFQYSYDVPEKPSQPTEMGPTARDDSGGGGEDDEVFVPPPNLDIPIDIEIPKTVKENARIEKTALFVHKQGLQMEILIKAKQSDNPQFGFLNQGHRLYKYYRHILSAIKNGLYQINTSATSKNDTKKEEDGDNPNDDHYLHPSLQSTTPTTATTSLNTATNDDDVVDDDTSSIPTLPYKPSANCSYSQLVNRIQGSLNEQHNQQQQFNDNMKLLPPIKSQEAYSQLTYEQQQYYQYYYMAQYYEYYKQLAQYQQNGGQQQQQQQVQPPEIHLDPTIQNYIQQMAYMQYQQQQQQQQANSVNPYAQIVNNLNNLTNCQQSETLSSSSIDQQQSFGVETRIVTKSSPKYDDEAEIKKPLLSLAQYGSDSDDDDGNDGGGGGDGGDYKVPIGEIKIVIDKMASYVAKNGEQFEEIVRAKGDPRFEFLNNSHDYYQYYRKKIKESLSNNNSKNKNNERLEEKREIKMVAVPLQKPKEKKVIAPVSFSIKKPKDDGPKEIKSALPIEESDDEEDVDKDIETKNDSDNNNNNNKDNDKIDNKLENNETDKTDEPILQINETIKNSNNSSNNNNNNKDGIFDTDDPILEMIDLTDDIDDKQRDIKRAEDKIKDKLALAAREKLVLVNRDNRALQLERKRKAAAFLALKSAETLNVTINNNEECRLPDPTEMIVDDIIAKKRSDDDDNDDDDQEDDEQLGDKRRSKKKKSHKRKHSKSKYDSKSGRKKSKKKRRRSSSGSSTNSRSS